MKKIILWVLLGMGLYSCQNNVTEQTSSSDSVQTAPDETLLTRYQRYLSQLDTTKIEENTKAGKKFQELFSSAPAPLADSAFLAFLGFYDALENGINRRMENKDSGYDSLLMEFGPTVRVKLSEKLLRFNNTLHSNGFVLDWEEGITYVIKDGAFIQKWFFEPLSPAMKEFLQQEEKENKAGFQSDGWIVIEAKDLADRVVWWEKFNRTHPDFILAPKAKAYERNYFQAFLMGMDNTPLLENENPPKVSGYFMDMYAYTLASYPGTTVAAKTKPYYAALQKNDLKESDRLRAEYLGQE